MKSKRWALTLVLLGASVAMVAGCGEAGDGAGAAAGVTVSDSAGVRVVELGDPGTLELPERSTAVMGEIGREGGTELFRVSGARLLESGRLAVGNSGTFEILYFEGDGALAFRAGREGDGPGEFRAITSFPGTAGDTLTIYDVRLGRLTTLDGEGAVVGTRPLTPPSQVVDLLPLTVGSDGRVVAVYGEARIFGTSGIRRDTVPLMVIDSSTAVDTVSLWPGKQWSFASTEMGAFRTEVGFGYAVEASGRDGHAVVGSTDQLRLTMVNAEGETVLRVAGSAPARTVSTEDVERWRGDRMAGLPDDFPASIRTAIEAAPHNETLPAFSGLLLDADGRIWIGESTTPGAVDRRWIVLEPDEERAFRVVLPGSAEPLDARGSLLVVLDHTELGEEIIRMVQLGEEVAAEGGAAEGGAG